MTITEFLILYYLEDLSSYPYYAEIMESPNQDEVIRKYIAAWAQWDGLEPPNNFKACGGKPKAGE